MGPESRTNSYIAPRDTNGRGLQRRQIVPHGFSNIFSKLEGEPVEAHLKTG